MGEVLSKFSCDHIPEGDSCCLVVTLVEQNAKLRSICAEVAYILFNLDVDYCGLCDRDSINHPCPVHTVKGGECLIESELRELGVGVEA